MTRVEAWHTCPLCGYRFRESPSVCRGCPVAVGCEAVCCPACRYQFVSGSRILGALHRLIGRFTGAKEKS